MPAVTRRIEQLKCIHIHSLGEHFAAALTTNDPQKTLKASYMLKIYCVQYKFTQEAKEFLDKNLRSPELALQLTAYYLKIIYNLYFGAIRKSRAARKLEKYTQMMNRHLSQYPAIQHLQDAIQAECWLLWHKQQAEAGLYLNKMYRTNNQVEARYLSEIYQFQGLLTRHPETASLITHSGYLILQAQRSRDPRLQKILLEQAEMLGDLRAVAQLAENDLSPLTKITRLNFVIERMHEQFPTHPCALNLVARPIVPSKSAFSIPRH